MHKHFPLIWPQCIIWSCPLRTKTSPTARDERHQRSSLPSQSQDLSATQSCETNRKPQLESCGGVCKLYVCAHIPRTHSPVVRIWGSAEQPLHACLSSASFVYGSPFQPRQPEVCQTQELNIERACHYQDHLRVKLLFTCSYFFPLSDKPTTQTMIYSMLWERDLAVM